MLPVTTKTGWSWIILTEEELQAANAQEDANPDESTLSPDYLKVSNPGLFQFDSKLSDKSPITLL